MWAGADWTWHKPVLRNDVITTQAYLKDLIEHQTKFAGRSFQQIYHVDFFNQHGDKVAEADSWCFRTDRDIAREVGTKYKEARERGVVQYTEEQLQEVYKLYRDEECRGATLRYWEDVTVGEKLPTMLKGPMTVTGFIGYAQGWGGLYIRTNKMAWGDVRQNIRVWASRTASAFRTARSACTGKKNSLIWSAPPAPMITARSAAPG